jgi:hypothetical protein
MTETLSYTGTLVVTRCWCGLSHAIPSDLYEQAKRRKDVVVYCPLGHTWIFRDTDEERIKRLDRRLEATRDLLRAEERSHSATRGHLTRAKKRERRVAAGVCPCCNRSFANLARHMAGQHPSYPPKEAS